MAQEAHVLCLLGVQGRYLQQIDDPYDAIQRSANFVAHVGEE